MLFLFNKGLKTFGLVNVFDGENLFVVKLSLVFALGGVNITSFLTFIGLYGPKFYFGFTNYLLAPYF